MGVMLGLLWALAVAAGADEPPILCLDPGGHTAAVHRVLFLDDGRRLLSTGEDKAIRLWDTISGSSERLMHLQTGANQEGMLYAAALSPDRRLLAVGGYPVNDVAAVTVIDVDSWTVVGSLLGHTDSVVDVAFGPDGDALASASLDGSLRVWSVRERRCRALVRLDRPLDSVVFAPDGRHLVAGDSRGELRCWPLRGEALDRGRMIATGHRDLKSLVWSPDGRFVAAGSYDHTVSVWRTSDWGPAGPPRTFGNRVHCLAVRPDGKALAVGIGGPDSDAREVVVVGLPGLEPLQRRSGAVDSITAVGWSRAGRALAAGDGVGSVQLWPSPDSNACTWLRGAGRSLTAAGWVRSGGQIAWGQAPGPVRHHNDRGPIERCLRVRDLAVTAAPAGDEWLRASTSWHEGRLSAQPDGTAALLQMPGAKAAELRPRPDAPLDRVNCFTFTPGGRVVVGSTFGLAVFAAGGRFDHLLMGHTGPVWAVAVSPDGRYALSASSDQTLRVWSLDAIQAEAVAPGPVDSRAEFALWADAPAAPATPLTFLLDDRGPETRLQPTGMSPAQPKVPSAVQRVPPLLSLFANTEFEWVAWTPEGYYACSPGAERMVGWQINRGIDKAADYYPAYQFRRQLYRPDVICRLLEAGSVAGAVKLADQDRRTPTDATRVAAQLNQMVPPKVTLVAPADGAVVTAAQLTVSARITDPNQRKVTSVKLLLNGRPAGARDFDVTAAQDLWTGTATLNPGENTLSVIAVNDAGSESVPVSVKVTYRAPEPEIAKPALYVLAVGVSKYADASRSLAFAAKDAADLVQWAKGQEGKLFGKVTCRLLADEQATRANTVDALDWLTKDVTQRDYAIVFISGHGTADTRKNYYFLPHDADPERLKSTAVPWTEFQTTFEGLPGKTFLLLDTCHAGGASGQKTKGNDNAYIDALREAAANDVGVITLASCMGNEQSLEDAAWQNGAFTKALVAGLAGAADANHDGVINWVELELYVTDAVKTITAGRQHVTCARPTTIRGDLPVAWTR